MGTGDGSTVAFSLDFTYVTNGTLTVKVNGVAQTEGVDYTVNYTTGVVTFTAAPTNGHAILATYRFRRLALFDGGYLWRKRAIGDGATITNTQLGIATFDLIESE